MVQLVRHGNKMNALASNSTIKRVEFATIHDIFVNLIWRAPLSAAAAPFVPRVVPVIAKPSMEPMAEVQEVTDVTEVQDEDEDEDEDEVSFSCLLHSWRSDSLTVMQEDGSKPKQETAECKQS